MARKFREGGAVMNKRMKRMTAILASLSVVSVASWALAVGSTPATKVIGLNVASDGTVVVSFGNGTTGTPTCSQDNEKMIIVATTDGGKALLNTVMATFLAGKGINAKGTGTCVAGNGLTLEKIASINTY